MATIDWSVRTLRDEEDIESVRRLFAEYRDWLQEGACLQDFERELDTLPGDYGPPKGLLLLGLMQGQPAGCVGFRPLGKQLPAGRFRLRACELKRLYVSPNARGSGLGRGLLRRALREAHSMRYQAMVLDTLPDRMQPALALYEQFGFVRCEAYYEDAPPEVRFMVRRLT